MMELVCQQAQVLEALVEHYNAGRKFQEVSKLLLQQPLLPDGSQAFSEEEILQSAGAVAAERMPRGMPLGDVQVKLSDTEQIAALSAAGLGRWARGRLAAPGSEGISLRTALLLETMIRLSGSQLTFADALSQVLWKSRACEPVRRSEHFMQIAEDLSWICRGDPSNTQMELAEDFFKAVTAYTGRRMYWRQWIKTGQILQHNPLLAGRLVANDLDRLFYQETRRQPTDRGHCISRIGFIRCLTLLAESAKTHPRVLFVCLASHVETLALELEQS